MTVPSDVWEKGRKIMLGDEGAGSEGSERQRGEGRRIWLLNMAERSYPQASQLPSQERLYLAPLLICGCSSLWEARPPLERRPEMQRDQPPSMTKMEYRKMKFWTVPGGLKSSKILPYHC